ncbi:MAG: hypothetical protein ABGY41_06730 [Candidatus Poribacteria bacterium]
MLCARSSVIPPNPIRERSSGHRPPPHDADGLFSHAHTVRAMLGDTVTTRPRGDHASAAAATSPHDADVSVSGTLLRIRDAAWSLPYDRQGKASGETHNADPCRP